MAQYKLAHIDMKGNRGELHDDTEFIFRLDHDLS